MSQTRMMNSNVRNSGKEMFKIENLRVLDEKLNYEHLLLAICNTSFPQKNNLEISNFSLKIPKYRQLKCSLGQLSNGIWQSI
jgi:hypothetical protein